MANIRGSTAKHIARRCIVFVSLVVPFDCCRRADGAVWEVTAVDPPECGRIQAVLAQTFPGDTVRVGPGHYLENLQLPHSCTILGSGESVTILEPCEGTGTVVLAENVPLVVIEDLAFMNGTGSRRTSLPTLYGGGGVFENCSKVLIEGCRFDDNRADLGGGIFLSGGSFDAVRTSFGNNQGDETGGAFYMPFGESAHLQECVMWWDRREAAYRGAIFVNFSQRFKMTDCTVLADVSYKYDNVITSIQVEAYDVSIEGCTFWDLGTTANATVADIFPFDVEGFPSDVSVEQTVVGASERLPGGSFVFGSDGGTVTMERITLVNRNLILVNFGTQAATFRNSIAQDATLSLIGRNGSDGTCNLFWNVDLDNRGFDLTGTRTLDPLLCGVAERNVNVEIDSPCRPEHSEGCGWIGALEGMCTPTPVLISGMEAVVSDRGVRVAWRFDGVEPQTEWSVWRLFGGEKRLVGSGQVAAIGLYSIEDVGSLPRGSIIYELRIREPESPWRTASSVEIEHRPSERLIVGGPVVSTAMTLRLTEGAVCRVIDAGGRVRATIRATISGPQGGQIAWDLRDDQGQALESGVYWATTEDRSERFVIVR